MIHIFHGPDTFSQREALEAAKGALGDPGLLEASTTRLEGKALSPQELALACHTAPFLTPSRLVVVTGLLERFEPRGGERAPDPGPFLPALEGLPPTTELFLVEARTLRAANPLFRALRGMAEVQDFPALKRTALQQWVQERVVGGGGRINPRAVALLAQTVGEDLWALSNEIEKLLLFAQGRPITEEDVLQVASPAREANIYAMADALLEGRTAEAGRYLHQLLDQGLVPAQLLFTTTRQLRHALLAQELRGKSPEEIGARLGLSGFPLEKARRQAQAFPRSRLEKAYTSLLETDLAIKTGRLSGELALDLLTAELGADSRH